MIGPIVVASMRPSCDGASCDIMMFDIARGCGSGWRAWLKVRQDRQETVEVAAEIGATAIGF